MSRKIIILNLYNILGKIKSIIDEYGSDKVILLGDLNADLKKSFGKELISFVNEFDLHLTDVEKIGLDSDTFTYYVQ